MVYQDYASSFTELLEKCNSATIRSRNIQLLATELVENAQYYYDLRKNTEFKRNNVLRPRI